MRIVIDIPFEAYAKLQEEQRLPKGIDVEYLIMHGTPLDTIKAEINRKADSGQWSEATVYGMKKAIAIIDHCTERSE